MLAESQVRLPTKEEAELAILLGRKVVIPTIKLLKGRLRKKSVNVRLMYGAVFTFYDPISIEDYTALFTKKINEFKVDKNKLEINGLTVYYSTSPNVKTETPVFLEAQYGTQVFEREEEIVSMITRIDQTRLFVYPPQDEISVDGLESYAKAFDKFIDDLELSLRTEKNYN